MAVINTSDGMESGTLAAPWWIEVAGGRHGTVVTHGYTRVGGSNGVVSVMRGMADADTTSPGGGSQLVYPGMSSYDVFDAATQNLASSYRTTRPLTLGGEGGRALNATDTFVQTTATTTTYNFMGNPLKKTVVASHYATANSAPTGSTNVVEYAYWGADRYWQQKAVRDEGAAIGADDRISFTDYYTAADPQGTRGQTRKVYDAKYTTFTADPNAVYPYGVTSASANAWKYDLIPQSDTHAARFAYDAKGRPVDVWKLQSAGTPGNAGTYAYVQTHTTYGQDGDGSWGQASSVTEDYSGINRTTNTLHYDSLGRADKVQDAKGQVFETHYDKDGVVQGVDRIVNGAATPVVTYTYGTTPATLTFGQVLTVKDELSGVEQSFGYCPTGGGKGQVSGVIESGGPNPSYSTAYTYAASGDRETSTLTSPEGTTKWRYADYVSLGEPTSPARVFRTLTKLNPTNNAPTPEEFHYAYDSAGRLREAAFAQTPSQGAASANGWYRNASGAPVLAAARARAHYEYDGAGRLFSVAHWWDTVNGNGNGYNAPVPILANACEYETTGLARGLKTANRFYRGSGSAWNLERTETYGYDPKNDQLTGANYGDGGANQTQSWSYDAAGNRASDSSNPGSWSYDNLNRILTGPGRTYTHDVLGNRLSSGPSASPTTYGWDAMGRMGSVSTMAADWSYTYRADGMRVRKQQASTAVPPPPLPSELTRYDGQMPVETVETSGSSTTVQRNAVGARGTDLIERTTNGTTQTRFPLYDTHGNSVATLGRSGSSWTLGDERAYDAWGRVRQGGQTGAPSARYCASLGHVQDDESGLVYMRARYYEAGTGRFVSEDSNLDGKNWFVYCANDPVNKIDESGHDATDAIFLVASILLIVGFYMMTGVTPFDKGIDKLVSFFAQAGSLWNNPGSARLVEHMLEGGMDRQIINNSAELAKLQGRKRTWTSVGKGAAYTALIGYSIVLLALVLDIDIGADGPGVLETWF